MKIFTPYEEQLILSHFAAQPTTLSADILQLLYAHKLFKLFVPVAMGGCMMNLPDALRLYQACARLDGNLAWLVVLGSGGGYFAGYLDEPVAPELFGPAQAVLAGSGSQGAATRTEHGILVSGHWPYCSGADFATLFTTGIALDGKALACVLMPSQVQIQQDWDGFGLEASSSHSIRCANAEVPRRFIFDLGAAPKLRDEPLYHFPFVTLAQLSFGAAILGMAQGWLDAAAHRQQAQPQSNQPRAIFTRELIANETQLLQALQQEFFQHADAAWQAHLTQPLQAAELAMTEKRVALLSSHVMGMTSRVAPHLGMALIKRHDPLNYHYRNLVTANQHSLLRSY